MKSPNLLIGTPTSRGFIPKNYHHHWFQRRVKAEAAEWLKRVRTQAALSGDELGALIGATGTVIYNWEHQDANIPLAGVVAICEALKIKPFFGVAR